MSPERLAEATGETLKVINDLLEGSDPSNDVAITIDDISKTLEVLTSVDADRLTIAGMGPAFVVEDALAWLEEELQDVGGSRLDNIRTRPTSVLAEACGARMDLAEASL
jgi:hypothetical protein